MASQPYQPRPGGSSSRPPMGGGSGPRPGGYGGGGGASGGQRRGGRPRFYARRKLCSYCVDHIDYVDYKDIGRLRRFISDRFRIEARRKSGACSKHQRALSTAIKRARHLAMLPYSPDHRSGMAGAAR